MKVRLQQRADHGVTATIEGCGVGGHVARFLFLEPYYGPVEVRFDGDSATCERSVDHGEVIATVTDSTDPGLWDQRAKREPYEPEPKAKETPRPRSKESVAARAGADA